MITGICANCEGAISHSPFGKFSVLILISLTTNLLLLYASQNSFVMSVGFDASITSGKTFCFLSTPDDAATVTVFPSLVIL